MHRNAENSTYGRTLRRRTSGAVVALGILAGGCAAHAQTPVLAAGAADRRLERWIDSTVAHTMERDRIPGAVVVWLQDGRRVERSYGVADAEALRPVTVAGTIFRIGSITKVITALAVVQLIERGRVDAEAPVSRYVPDLRTVGPGGEPILVRHLLDHSGGYDQIGARRQAGDPTKRETIRSFLARELRPLRRPGAVGVYDTYGITLAGHLVERVSGVSYAEYVHRNIFEPLGMLSSWVEAPEQARSRLAVGYGLEDGRLEPQEYEWYVTLPASSVDATGADMGRLLVALLGDGGGVVGPAIMERMRTERLLSYGSMGAFSWGFWEEQRNGYRALHHGGVMRGYTSELYLVPAARTGFFVAYNRDGETGPPARLREALADLLFDRVLPRTTAAPALPSAPLVAAASDRVTGVYGNTVACYTCPEGEGWQISTITVTAESPGVITLNNGSARFVATDELTYVSEGAGRELRFLTDDAERVRYMAQGPNSFVRLDDALLSEVLGPGWRARPPEPISARVARLIGDWPAAGDAYASLSNRAPDNGRFAFYEGFSRLHTGEWEAARAAFRRALALAQWESWSRYYIAAALAGDGDVEAALRALHEAVDSGFRDPHLLNTDPWWQNLRTHPDFQAIVSSITGRTPEDAV